VNDINERPPNVGKSRERAHPDSARTLTLTLSHGVPRERGPEVRIQRSNRNVNTHARQSFSNWASDFGSITCSRVAKPVLSAA
jgi:hypothetical protein